METNEGMNNKENVTVLAIREAETAAGNENAAGNESNHQMVHVPQPAVNNSIQQMNAKTLEDRLLIAFRKERYALVRERLGISMREWASLVQMIEKFRPRANVGSWAEWGGVQRRGLFGLKDQPRDVVVVCLKAIVCMMMCGGAKKCFSSTPIEHSGTNTQSVIVGHGTVSTSQSTGVPISDHPSIDGAPSGPGLQNIPSGSCSSAGMNRLAQTNPATVENDGRGDMDYSITGISHHENIWRVPSGQNAVTAAVESDTEELDRSITDMISYYSSNIQKVTSKEDTKTESTTMGDGAIQPSRSIQDPIVEPDYLTSCSTVSQPPSVITPDHIHEIAYGENRDTGDGAQDSILGASANGFSAAMGQLMTPEEYALRQEAYDNTNDGWVVDRMMDANPHVGMKRKADNMLEYPDTSCYQQLENPTFPPLAAAHPEQLQSFATPDGFFATPTDFHTLISFYVCTPFLQLPYRSMFLNGGNPPVYELVQLRGHVPLAYFVAQLRYIHQVVPDLDVCAIDVVVGAKSFFLNLLDWADSELKWTMVVGLMLLGEEQTARVSASVRMNDMVGMAEV